jgi:hypothetical protein
MIVINAEGLLAGTSPSGGECQREPARRPPGKERWDEIERKSKKTFEWTRIEEVCPYQEIGWSGMPENADLPNLALFNIL